MADLMENDFPERKHKMSYSRNEGASLRPHVLFWF